MLASSVCALREADLLPVLMMSRPAACSGSELASFITFNEGKVRLAPADIDNEPCHAEHIADIGKVLCQLSRKYSVNLQGSFFLSSNDSEILQCESMGCRGIKFGPQDRKRPSGVANGLLEATNLALRLSRTDDIAPFFSATTQERLVREHYTVEAPQYDSAYRRRLDNICDEITWRSLATIIPSAGTVADLGGGTGNWAVKLDEVAGRVLIVDISMDMLREARSKSLPSSISLLCASLSALPIPDRSLDLCLAEGDILSYCASAPAALAEIARVLRPGAALVLSVESLLFRAMRALQRGCSADQVEEILLSRYVPFELLEGSVVPRSPGFAVRAFTSDELYSLITGYGFRVEVISPKPLFSSILGYQQVADLENVSDDELIRLESLAAIYPGASDMGFHLHVVARRA